MSLVFLTPQLFESVGVAGNTTTPVVDSWLSVQQRLTGYQHSISATFGFESCSLTYAVTLEEGMEALQNMLMRSLVVTGPEAIVCWEGYCNRVELNLGPKTVSVSLDNLANRVRGRFTAPFGGAGVTAASSDATSIVRYGTKDAVIQGGKSLSEANDLVAKELARRKNVFAPSGTTVGMGDMQSGITLTLTFEGWYGVLGWLLTSVTTTSTADTGTQVGSLLSTYTATNNFLSTSTANIITTGRNVTQYIAPDTSYRSKIEDILKRGNSSNQRLAWGVYADRKFYLKEWAGATPSTISYRQALGDHRVFDSASNPVAPWDVRPDAMIETSELLDVGPATTAADAAGRFYVERVVCKVDSNGSSVELQPQASDSLDAQLAFFAGRG